MNVEDVIEAWRVNNAVTLELLGFCPDGSMDFKPGKGKTIRSNFVHILWVRGQFIKDKFPKQTLDKLDWKTATPKEIRAALETTETQMQDVFRKSVEKQGRTNFLTHFAYLIAHEAHHRSQIEIALRLNGADLSDEAWYGWWDWAKK